MKEVVPFDRVFLAPPSGTVKDSDYLSFQDYEKISGIRVNNAVLNKQNKELYRKWQEANGIAVAPAESAEEKVKATAKEPQEPQPFATPSSVEDAKEVAVSSEAKL